MKIAIFGSTGFLGKVLLKKALERGYEVKTLVRNPEKLGEFKDKVEFLQGDIFQTKKVSECVSGVKAVFSTVPPEGDTKEPEKYGKAMKDLVGILEEKGIKRLIYIGGAVVLGGKNENWTLGRRFLRLFLSMTWKGGLIAKKMEWEELKKSKLDWTLIRPPAILPGKSKGKLIADEKNLPKVSVYAEDLADFMLDQIDSKDWIKKVPLVASVTVRV
jgi:putative NADH-flavin reductase